MGGLLFPPPQRHGDSAGGTACLASASRGDEMGREGKVAPWPSPPASRDMMGALGARVPPAALRSPSPILPTPQPQQGTACPRSHLRDAGVQHGAEEGLAVVGADGGGQEGQQVILEEALAEELIEQPAGVEGAQGAFEPGVLNGDIHGGQRLCGHPGRGDGQSRACGQRTEELGHGPCLYTLGQKGGIRGICLESASSGGRPPSQQNRGPARLRAHLSQPWLQRRPAGTPYARRTGPPGSFSVGGSVSPMLFQVYREDCPLPSPGKGLCARDSASLCTHGSL